MGISKAAFLFLFLLSSVKGDILDDYLRTDGIWILTRNKQFYKTNNEKECAEKCEAEGNFNCRAFLFTRKKLQCLTLAENAKMTVTFNSTDAVLFEKKIYLLQCKKGIGKDYRGTEAKTWRGIPCQMWAEKTPHNPNYTPEKHPKAGLDRNYCRNPDGDENGPWCYTTDPATRFDYCNIPECEGQVTHTGEAPTVECMRCNGEDYHGEVSRTESGLECQRWDAQEPHMHRFTLKHFPEKDLKMNYCRNPNGELRPWCFTTSPTKRWEYCNIPRCSTPPPVSGPGSQCLSGKGEDYRGRISITESGNACQHWNVQFPHKHGWIPGRYPCKGLEENYCRNPDGEKRPWCYTTMSSVRWEYCAIPHCDETEQVVVDAPMKVPLVEECYQGKGQSYRGTTSITASGKKCQAWNSMFPHRHEKTPDRFPDADLRDNYCRNPDGDSSPWCFTTDPSVTWEYCSLKRCDDHTQEHIPNDPPATMARNLGLTTPNTPDCMNGNGKDYRGTVAKTAMGRTCQEWSSQKPHSHKYFTPMTHPRAGLDKNYCRNPDGDVNGVWCFTTDPEKKWEYCEIPRCSSSENECGKVLVRSERACEQYSMCNAPAGFWPWHVSLRTSTNKHHCAGTLIHPQWVLTAARCLQESTEPSSYRVFLGIQSLNTAEPSLQIQSVQKVLKEPSGADIALMKLNSPVTITDRVKPVCLPETSLMVERNAVCFLTAWGKMRGTDTDNRLKDVEFPVLENRICNLPEFLNGSVRNHEFCGGFTFGSIDNCEAEAGGPLVCQDKDRFVQYGVTSWGLDCTQPSKPVFVQIPRFVSWIKNAMFAH
ncbi:plasminogen-like isoform X1 [Neopsephotus bourkii]|uniref:plasminogen-like isoform X1 n=1 Tax=Neopsephotus bourkii TaxID=309878 RepID=UPI002AA566F3|nr:plasminogen-like isoform X1 [Neopsephotus bourkii]